MPTKKQRNRRLDKVEEQLTDAAESAVGDRWTVEFREAEPAERPEGVSVDAESRTIYYDVWQAQRDTLDALARSGGDVSSLLGGYAAGKSVFGARWILKQALDNPDSRFLVLGVSYSEARTATYRVLFEQLPGERTHVLTSSFVGPEQSPLVEDYNRTTHQLTLVNDTTITLGSADKWSRHAGDEYGAIWADEPSHYAVSLHDLLEMMGSRLRGQDGAHTQLWTLTGNGFNDAWTILEKRETEDGEPLGHDIEVVTADTRNNPYLSEGEKESFERQYADTAREEQAISGGFASAQGRVYSNFTRETHVVEHAEALDAVDESDEWRILGYDAGYRDPRVLLEVAKTDYGQLVALSEFHKDESHIEDAIHWLKANEIPLGSTIYCEHEPADIEKYRSAGYDSRKANKSIDAGVAEVRNRFESDESGRPGLLISEQCENLIRELHGYRHEQVGTAAAEDHMCDSLRYLCVGHETDPPQQAVFGSLGVETRDLAKTRDTNTGSESSTAAGTDTDDLEAALEDTGVEEAAGRGSGW